MEQEALDELRPVSPQGSDQPDEPPCRAASVYAQALAGQPGLSHFACQPGLSSQGDDCRRPPTTVEPRGQAYQRPLGAADVQVGNYQGHRNRSVRPGLSTGAGKSSRQALPGKNSFLI